MSTLDQGNGATKAISTPTCTRASNNGHSSSQVIHDPWVLSDEILFQICRVAPAKVTAEWLADLRRVSGLIGHAQLGTNPRLKQAMSLLASLLGRIPQYHPKHLPFGYGGPELRSEGWIDRDILEHIGKQIVGLLWHDRRAEAVADAVEVAVSEAIHVGFLQEKRYDAWCRGMPTGSGWRSAVSATPYGLVKARGRLDSTPAVQVPALKAPTNATTNGACAAARPTAAPKAASLTPPATIPASASVPSSDAVRCHKSSGPPVQIGHAGEPCVVCGKPKKPLTDAQHAVISALLRAGDAGLNKDGLEAIRASARRILKDLCEDPDWADVVLLPGQTNGRYRIRV